MNSAPHLRDEDRRDFERVLDEALRSASHHRDLSAVGEPLTAAQLRSMALDATALITAAAAGEYERYVRLRDELRTPAPTARTGPSAGAVRGRGRRGHRAGRDGTARAGDRAPVVAPHGDTVPDGDTAPHGDRRGDLVRGTDPCALPDRDARPAPDGTPVAPPTSGRAPGGRPLPGRPLGGDPHGGPGPVGGTQLGGLLPGGTGTGKPEGAGLAAVVAVLTPVLAGAAAVMFLLVGYALELVDPAPAFAKTLLTTGWVFGAITAAAILVAAIGLLITALRNSSTSLRADDRAGLDVAVVRARETWHQALLERGVVPFLQEALVKPGGDTSVAHPAPTSRIPHLGYHRPGFSSPERGHVTAFGPRYSSPDFSSPAFGGSESSAAEPGGPEHLPE